MKAVIFDMDGVIFDSERAMLWSLQEVCRRRGIKDVTPYYPECIGVTREMTVQIFQKVYGADFDVEEFMAEGSRLYHERYDGGRMPVKEGARELLTFLSERKVPLALASSTRIESVKRQMKEAGLISFFEKIIGGDMVTKSKPEPDIFLCAAKELGVTAEDCIVIEDSYNGIRAAHAAGMTPVMVPDMLEPNEEITVLCAKICKSLKDFHQLLVDEVFPFR